MAIWKKVVIGLLCLFGYIYNPYQLRTNTFNMVNSLRRLAQPQNPNSLKFVMRNTTGDFDQVRLITCLLANLHFLVQPNNG